MKWFLIIFIKMGYSGGLTTIPEPYTALEPCEAAVKQIEQTLSEGYGMTVHAYCIPR